MGERLLEQRRLVWLTHGSSATTPSQRLRVHALADDLSKAMAAQHGVALSQSYVAAPRHWRQAWRMREGLGQADWVILQKEPIPRFALMLVRHYARWLAFDYDDTMSWRVKRDGRCVPSAKRSAALRRIARACDLVVVGNRFLMAEASEHGARATLELPTAVAHTEPHPTASRHHGPVRLGWIGSNANLHHLERLEPVLLALQQRGIGVELHVMAGRPPLWKRFEGTRFSTWSADSEAEFLRAFDIGLMPLDDTPHTRGKCAYKALQYMATQRPVVAQDVGINREWIGDAGITVSTPEQWIDALQLLAEDPERRQAMGVRGSQIIAERFTQSIIASTLASALMKGLA